ncbi:MAG: NADAR family protein [Xanthomonadaceae bacterium]|nr:NADAR family protein [Xanthomonadaceae bacterium]
MASGCASSISTGPLATIFICLASPAGRRLQIPGDHRYHTVLGGEVDRHPLDAQYRRQIVRVEAAACCPRVRRFWQEASPEDRIWSIGLAVDHPDGPDSRRWQGMNMLGFALMEVRAQLREQMAGS